MGGANAHHALTGGLCQQGIQSINPGESCHPITFLISSCVYASKKRFYVQLLVSVQIFCVIKKLSPLIIDDIVNPLSVKDFVIINCMLLTMCMV